ncbi:hypothetical protein ACFW7K_12690 [Streptomyces sp. NPDC058735]|uniref:hypothetical protein n=1 Tax=Streptomyces sp. NPDC058735 TaxID=3346616 RepID=UPI0036873BBD
MAERRRRALEVSRTDQLADMRERLRELGDHASLTELDAAMAGWQSTEWAGQYTDPLTGMLELTTADVKSALREQGIPQERLDSVQVCTVPQDDVSALMTPFADRSGLVTISDSVLSLAGQYGQYTGRGLTRLSAGPVRGRLRAFRSVTRGTLEEDPAVLTAYLRYYNVNQRVYGLSAKLGLNASPKEAETGSLVALQATRFGRGGEVQGIVLSGVSGFRVAEEGVRLREVDEVLLRGVTEPGVGLLRSTESFREDLDVLDRVPGAPVITDGGEGAGGDGRCKRGGRGGCPAGCPAGPRRDP